MAGTPPTKHRNGKMQTTTTTTMHNAQEHKNKRIQGSVGSVRSMVAHITHTEKEENGYTLSKWHSHQRKPFPHTQPTAGLPGSLSTVAKWQPSLSAPVCLCKMHQFVCNACYSQEMQQTAKCHQNVQMSQCHHQNKNAKVACLGVREWREYVRWDNTHRGREEGTCERERDRGDDEMMR